MERLTKRGFNFTTDFIKRSIDSWSIAQALSKLQKYEDLEEDGKLPVIPCKLGDTVYDIVECDDGVTRIFPMKVCNINVFGDIHKNKVWNVYLEDRFSKAYRSFYDFGTTVFDSQEKAEEALEKLVG